MRFRTSSLGVLFIGLMGCGGKATPENKPAAAVTSTRIPEATHTRIATERGYLTRDPHAARAAASSIAWQHASLAVDPLTGVLIVAAEDIRLPIDSTDLVLARTFSWGTRYRWDERFGLGPSSPRCALDAACDAAGNVIAWREDGRLIEVTRDATQVVLSSGGRPFVQIRYDDAGVRELRATRIGASGEPATWPWHVRYTHDAAGRLALTDANARLLRYAYDAAGQLVEHADRDGTITIGYDERGRVTSLQGPGALRSRLAYGAAEGSRRSQVTVTDTVGSETRISWLASNAIGGSEVEVRGEARHTTWRFDPSGRIAELDDNGAPTRFTYDDDGRLASVRYPDGLRQAIERDAAGAIGAVVEGTRRVALTYTADGHIASLSEGSRRENWSWSPAPAARLMLIEHVSGRLESFVHDALGRVTRFDNGAGAVTELVYDEVTGLVVATVDERGAKRTYAYDARARPTRTTRADGSIETWGWDLDDRLISHGVPGRPDTIFEYAEGRLARVVRGSDVMSWSYDALGRTVSESNPMGATGFGWSKTQLIEVRPSGEATLRREHDEVGRVIREVLAGGGERKLRWQTPREGGQLLSEHVDGIGDRHFTWDASSRLMRIEERLLAPGASRDVEIKYLDDGAIEMRDETGTVWAYHVIAASQGVDAQRVLGSVLAASGPAEGYRYDARARLIEKTSSEGDGFTIAYDLVGRPTEIGAAGGTTRMTWAGAHMSSLTNDAGLSRRYEHDGNGRPTRVVQGEASWALEYAAGPDILALSDPLGRRTTFAWDPYHRLVSRTRPWAGTEGFAYDETGRLVSRTLADGGTQRWDYDARGRLARHSAGDITLRELRWDERGRVIGDRGPGHDLSVSHDDERRLRVSHDARTNVATQRVRDAQGRTESLTIAGANVARYVRGVAGRLTRVEGAGGFALEFDYDLFGHRSGMRLPDGGRVSYVYDRAQRPTRIEVHGNGGAKHTIRLSYDGAGRLSEIDNGGRMLRYSYGDGMRLASYALPDASVRRLSWGRAGDLVNMGSGELRYDDVGRVIMSPSGARTYDQRGRMIARERPVREALVYDEAGHLVRVERADLPTIHYRYDADGRLLARVEADSETRFAHDGDDLLEMRGATGTTSYVPGQFVGERLGLVTPAGPRYLVQAPDGSTLAVVTGEGAIVDTMLHEPFGRSISASTASDPFHYRGHFTDPVTGLIHHAFRWYDPEVGAFCAPDPDAGDFMSPETLNAYAYLGGDPVNRVDPLGAAAHEWQTGATCLEQVCNLFQAGKIQAGGAVRGLLDGYSYAGAVDRNGWSYDVWSKRIPGTDKVLTVFRDLNTKAEGPFGSANFTGNFMVRGAPAVKEVLGNTAQTTQGGGQTLMGRVGGVIREGVDQAKIGVQLYGKEVATTVTGLGGLSGTLGTGVKALAALPGGGLIIAAGVTLAGAVGYGVGTLVNKIPGVSEGAKTIIGKVMGYDKDMVISTLEAQEKNEGERAKELRTKEIEKNITRDTMPKPYEPAVAGGSVDLGGLPEAKVTEPPAKANEAQPEPVAPPQDGKDRESPRDKEKARAEGGEREREAEVDEEEAGDDEDEKDDDEGEKDDAEGDEPVIPEGAVVPNLLDLVKPRRVSVTFTEESDHSAKGYPNIVRCTHTVTFWNVGMMASGYGGASTKGMCVSSLNGSSMAMSAAGRFTGGPNGVVILADEDGEMRLALRGGTTMVIPGAGSFALPSDAFADWPRSVP